MSELNITRVFDLLEKANDKGVTISLANNELSVKYSRNKEIDQLLLSEIKANKDDLLRYFRDMGTGKKSTSAASMKTEDSLEYEGEIYYDLAPTQTWWVTENDRSREFKQRAFALIGFVITGRVDMEVFNKVVACFVRRHESLRSTYHIINGKYMIRITDADSPGFNIDYKDLRGVTENKEDAVEKLFFYDDHRFNMQDGPLFLSRLIQTSETDYIMSFKLHHVIYDGWSIEIMLRDLAAIYKAFIGGKEPELPEMQLQYKEFMALMRAHIRENFDREKAYWQSLHAALPPELIIPGARTTDDPSLSKRAYKGNFYQISKETVQKLNRLGKNNGTSIFVILQAAFKHHLYRVTGQRDLVIGTIIFGRDELPGCEDQIGFYAKIALIWTMLDNNDSFTRVVQKVKKSNEDMQQYRACSLIDHLSGMLQEGQLVIGTFWKINIQYVDKTGYYVGNYTYDDTEGQTVDVQRIHTYTRQNYIYEVDIQLEFFNMAQHMELKVVHDSKLYDEPLITSFMDGYVDYLEYIANNLAE